MFAGAFSVTPLVGEAILTFGRAFGGDAVVLRRTVRYARGEYDPLSAERERTMSVFPSPSRSARARYEGAYPDASVTSIFIGENELELITPGAL